LNKSWTVQIINIKNDKYMIMSDKNSTRELNNPLSREMPHTHLYHILLPLIFMGIWMIDTFFLHLTTWLNFIVYPLVRLVFFIIIVCIGIIIIQLAHKTLFEGNKPSDTLLMEGILRHVRNPMYLGIILFYITILFLSISAISIIFFIFAILVYNKMVNYEENILEKKFGKEYIEYQKKVPKWIPSIKTNL